jgi:ubiquinone/menaquinone biosynthesis C-methylase UbiE
VTQVPPGVDDEGSPEGVRREVFDHFAPGYEQLVDGSIAFTGRDASFFAERKVELLARLQRMRGLDLRDASLLDVGCGTGTTDRLLDGQVRTLCGVDISEEMLVMARKNVPEAEFRSYDGTTLPFDSGSFDVVVAICALHHVPPADREHFVGELHRVARPGGLIAIFEHNPANPLTRRAVRGCEFDVGVELLSAGTVKRLLAASGAKVLRGDYLLFTPLGGSVGANVDWWLRRIPLGGQHAVTAEAQPV